MTYTMYYKDETGRYFIKADSKIEPWLVLAHCETYFNVYDGRYAKVKLP